MSFKDKRTLNSSHPLMIPREFKKLSFESVS